MSGTKGGGIHHQDSRVYSIMICRTIVRAEEDSVSGLSNLVEAAETDNSGGSLISRYPTSIYNDDDDDDGARCQQTKPKNSRAEYKARRPIYSQSLCDKYCPTARRRFWRRIK